MTFSSSHNLKSRDAEKVTEMSRWRDNIRAIVYLQNAVQKKIPTTPTHDLLSIFLCDRLYRRAAFSTCLQGYN
ncbi:hypothetical protein OnM2_088028 [Erysiphe neolycopersici]|uniref:Uncharacterized protein n=1 Tax=Erysiphe neolycopersici TaxID=212602 RepID=A0A420HE08_9PEZI|nr:hypothetical protein OnM2_088028 [Erysiphe neolycopersici]